MCLLHDGLLHTGVIGSTVKGLIGRWARARVPDAIVAPHGRDGVSDGYFLGPTVEVRQTYVEEIYSP